MATIDSTLPDPVRALMERKLRLLKKALEQEYINSRTQATRRLLDEMQECIATGDSGKAMFAVPLAAYREIAADAVAMTQRWPMAVWDAMAQVLNKAGLCGIDAAELNAMADEFAWANGQAPFTLSHIQTERFRDMVFRYFSDLGISYGNTESSFERRLNLLAASSRVAIRNLGWHAREGVAVAIDEYVIAVARERTQSANESSVQRAPTARQDAEQANPCAVFKSMEKLTADEITITFVGDKVEVGVGANGMLEIFARGETRRLPWATLDLVNRNTGNLNNQGVLLLGLAETQAVPGIEKNRKMVSRLREVLREHLGIPDDPFEAFQQGQGWKPRFKIADRRGDADERAKRNAERRSMSLDQQPHLLDGSGRHADVDEDYDEADAWLRNHDSD